MSVFQSIATKVYKKTSRHIYKMPYSKPMVSNRALFFCFVKEKGCVMLVRDNWLSRKVMKEFSYNITFIYKLCNTKL